MAQETLTRALQGLSTLKRRDRFAAWLGRICRYVAYDYLKKSHAKSVSYEPIDHRLESVSTETIAKVNEALKQLSPKERQVIVMRYYHDRSYEQMAAILNTSKPGINGLLTRAKKKLEQHLQTDMSDEV